MKPVKSDPKRPPTKAQVKSAAYKKEQASRKGLEAAKAAYERKERMKGVKAKPKSDPSKEKKYRQPSSSELFKEAKRRADMKKNQERAQEAYKKLKVKAQRNEYLKSNPQAGRVSPAQRAAGFNK